MILGHQLGATTINSFSYTYDKVGNRKSKTSRDEASYDVFNRVAQVLSEVL